MTENRVVGIALKDADLGDVVPVLLGAPDRYDRSMTPRQKRLLKLLFRWLNPAVALLIAVVAYWSTGDLIYRVVLTWAFVANACISLTAGWIILPYIERHSE